MRSKVDAGRARRSRVGKMRARWAPRVTVTSTTRTSADEKPPIATRAPAGAVKRERSPSAAYVVEGDRRRRHERDVGRRARPTTRSTWLSPSTTAGVGKVTGRRLADRARLHVPSACRPLTRSTKCPPSPSRPEARRSTRPSSVADVVQRERLGDAVAVDTAVAEEVAGVAVQERRVVRRVHRAAVGVRGSSAGRRCRAGSAPDGMRAPADAGDEPVRARVGPQRVASRAVELDRPRRREGRRRRCP